MRLDDASSGSRTEAERNGEGRVATSDVALRRIGNALHGLRYGSVLVIVQDGVVVQIERTEKTRLTR